MFLDDQLIFKGEIAKAAGVIQGGIQHFGDVRAYNLADM